jgi:hypothetical protein
MFAPDIIFGERIASPDFCHTRKPGQIGALNKIRGT